MGNISLPPGFGKRYILVTISEAETKIEAYGFEGKTCHGATKPYEDALGGKCTENRDKGPDVASVVKMGNG